MLWWPVCLAGGERKGEAPLLLRLAHWERQHGLACLCSHLHGGKALSMYGLYGSLYTINPEAYGPLLGCATEELDHDWHAEAQSTRMRAVKYFWDMSCTHSHILLMLDAIMHVYQAGKNVKLPHLQPLHGRRQRQEASRLKTVCLLGSRRLCAQLPRDGQLTAHIAGCSTVLVWSCLLLPVLRCR